MDTTALEQIMSMNPYLLAFIITWAFFWKGLSMWKAAKKNHMIWFIILLVFNTFGILDVLYIFLFSELNISGNNNEEIEKVVKKKKARRK